MAQGARSAITLAALGVLLVLGAAWGWNAATEPLPAKVDTPICTTQTIAAGQKVFPQDVTVSVYNAGTRDGLAGRVMKDLHDDGFAEGNVGDTKRRRKTLPMILQWDESFDIGSDTLTGVNDSDYQPPFPLTAKLNKLTIKIDRPQLSPEDIEKLEAAMRNNKSSE